MSTAAKANPGSPVAGSARVVLLAGADTVALDVSLTQLIHAAGPDATLSRYTAEEAVTNADTLVSTMGTPGLFGDQLQVVTDAGKLPVAFLDQIVERASAPAWSGLVVLCATKLPPARTLQRLRALGAAFQEISHDLPRSFETRRWVKARAQQCGLALDASALADLDEIAAADPDRVSRLLRDIAVVLAAGPGSPRPVTGSTLTALLSPAAASGKPWEAGEAVEADNLAGALALSGDIEPVVALALLATRWTHAGWALAEGLPAPARVHTELGLPSVRAAQSVLALADRLRRSYGPAATRAAGHAVTGIIDALSDVRSASAPGTLPASRAAALRFKVQLTHVHQVLAGGHDCAAAWPACTTVTR